MTIYQVFHKYDVDGGFGDAVGTESLEATFSTKEMAEKFKAEYENPHIYDRPYQPLFCGTLEIRQIELDDEEKFDKEDMWWWDDEEDEQDE